MLGTPTPCRLSRFAVEPGGYNPEWREPDGAAGSCDTGVGGPGGRAGGVRRARRVVARRLPPGPRAGSRGRTGARRRMAAAPATDIAPRTRNARQLRIVLSTMAECQGRCSEVFF